MTGGKNISWVYDIGVLCTLKKSSPEMYVETTNSSNYNSTGRSYHDAIQDKIDMIKLEMEEKHLKSQRLMRQEHEESM